MLFSSGYHGLLYIGTFSVTNITFVVSIQNTNVANTLVMIAMAPMLSAILGAIFLKELPDRKTWITIFVTFTAAIYIFYDSIQLGNFFALSVYAQAEANMDNSPNEHFAMIIHSSIPAGAMHRQIWYLNRDAQAALDSLLRTALKVRGDAVAERFASMEASEDMPALNETKLTEIREALAEAKVALIDNAPKVVEQEAE